MPQKILKSLQGKNSRTIVITALLVGATWALFVWVGCWRTPMKWVVYYGDSLRASDIQGVDLAIVDPDLIRPDLVKPNLVEPFLTISRLFSSKTQWIAYLSLGEVNASRPYWKDLKAASAVLSENPHWPGAYRVDFRSEAWRRKLLEDLIPEFMAKGYVGVFLDTIDVPIEQERTGAAPGSRRALVDFVKEARKLFPRLKIIPNNGLEVLPEIQDEIWGVVVEDLYTRHDFSTEKSVPTPEDEAITKEKVLDAFIKTGKPVLTLLYDQAFDTPLVKRAIDKSERKGYGWYWSRVDLSTLGVMN